MIKDSSTRLATTKRSAESISQSRKKSFTTSSSVPRIVLAKEKTSSNLAKGNRENSSYSQSKANLARPMSQVVKKPTAAEKPAGKMLPNVPKPVLQSKVTISKGKNPGEPQRKVPMIATPILHSKTALSKQPLSKRPSRIPVRSFQIEADPRKPYQPPKPIGLSRIALLKKENSKLASRIPIMELKAVEKKCGQCLYTPVNKSAIAISKKGNSKIPSRIPIRKLSPASLQKETKVADKIQNLKEKEMSATASEVNLRYELYVVLNMAV